MRGSVLAIAIPRYHVRQFACIFLEFQTAVDWILYVVELRPIIVIALHAHIYFLFHLCFV